MGRRLLASCTQCQFQEMINEGGTMATFTTHDPFPAYCPSCNSLVSVNRLNDHLHCPRCESSEVTLYGDRTRLRSKGETACSESWSAGGHICPDCETFGLRFTTIALVD